MNAGFHLPPNTHTHFHTHLWTQWLLPLLSQSTFDENYYISLPIFYLGPLKLHLSSPCPICFLFCRLLCFSLCTFFVEQHLHGFWCNVFPPESHTGSCNCVLLFGLCLSALCTSSHAHFLAKKTKTELLLNVLDSLLVSPCIEGIFTPFSWTNLWHFQFKTFISRLCKATPLSRLFSL
jgi:hypothetical protein